MREVNLPSGAILRVKPSSFPKAKALVQVVMTEGKSVNFRSEDEMNLNFKKEVFCTMLSSKVIERAVWDCFDQALYNDQKINEKTFENPETWDDYFTLCFEVAKENINPFMKSLYAELSPLLGLDLENPASRPKTTTS